MSESGETGGYFRVPKNWDLIYELGHSMAIYSIPAAVLFSLAWIIRGFLHGFTVNSLVLPGGMIIMSLIAVTLMCIRGTPDYRKE